MELADALDCVETEMTNLVSGWRGKWKSKGSSVEDENSIYAPSATRRHKIISLDVPGEKEMGHMNNSVSVGVRALCFVLSLA